MDRMKISELTASSPLKDLRQFIKQEGLNVSGQVGGRSRRTTQDVLADILEVIKEKEEMDNLRRPLFEDEDKNDSQPLEVEEDLSSDEEEEERVLMPPPKTPLKTAQPQQQQVTPRPEPEKKKVYARIDEKWSQWILMKSQQFADLSANFPQTPAIFELGICIKETRNEVASPSRYNKDRIRITNIKYLGVTSDLQSTVNSLNTNSRDSLHKKVSGLVDAGYDIFIHVLPCKTKGAAERAYSAELGKWCYEWNAADQERCKGKKIEGKVYFPQPIEVDDDVIMKLNNLTF